jgi:hypothetical protein
MSNLPGSIHTVVPGTPCEDCGKPATILLQGETDSFGAEYHPLCDVCRKAYETNEPHISDCDLCHAKQVETKPWRDFEEGSNGPVYYICAKCLLSVRCACSECINEVDDRQDVSFDDEFSGDYDDEVGGL